MRRGKLDVIAVVPMVVWALLPRGVKQAHSWDSASFLGSN